MKKLETKVALKIYENVTELDQSIQDIMQLATKQLDHAYAPYSNFYVGAAALLTNGNTHTGCNQENASYPLCICAERVALYSAGSVEPNATIKAVAITAKNPKKEIRKPISPCGACRQVILEFQNKQKAPIEIYLKADGPEIYLFESAQDLLPFSFDSSFL